MKIFIILLISTLVSLYAQSKTVTVELPNKYQKSDLNNVKILDTGEIYAYYQGGNKKGIICSRLEALQPDYPKHYTVNLHEKTPLEPICEAAIEAVIKAMKH